MSTIDLQTMSDIIVDWRAAPSKCLSSMSDEMPRDPIDLACPTLSVAREKLLEHRLLSDLAVLMLQRGSPLEVLRSEYDSRGYDVVLEASGLLRHLQLKASRQGGKRRHVTISVHLRAKPSGCVVWMFYDPVSLAITELRWFGALPGESLPDLGSAVARYTKGTSEGVKNLRPALRNVGVGKFELLEGVHDLADRLFGKSMPATNAIAVTQLRARFGQEWRNSLRESLRGDGFDASAKWAHLLDGYSFLDQCLETDFGKWLEPRARDAEQGRFPSDAGSLWAHLFFEHRRQRFVSRAESPDDALAYRDELTRRARAAIDNQILSA